MKYDQIKDVSDDQLRRLTGVKRKTFEKMIEIWREADLGKKSEEGARTNDQSKTSS